jgi:hypothetical protein
MGTDGQQLLAGLIRPCISRIFHHGVRRYLCGTCKRHDNCGQRTSAIFSIAAYTVILCFSLERKRDVLDTYHKTLHPQKQEKQDADPEKAKGTNKKKSSDMEL